MTSTHDFVIVGGGPAGLSAAITATRAGCDALVLEQGALLGPAPRGEGVSYHPLFDQLLGKGFLVDHSFETRRGAVYHSPGAVNHVALPATGPLYFFEWRELIDRLGEVASGGGAELRTGCRVTGVEEDDRGRCRGVRYVDGEGVEHSAHGRTVLGCDGHRSVIGRHYQVDSSSLSCPIIKCRLAQAGFDADQTRALQFFFIGNGDLPKAPRFPPSVAYAFPLADAQMEVGLMLRMGRARSMSTVDRPDTAALMAVWEDLKQGYPIFHRYFEGAQIEHEEPTDLPNAGLWRNNVPATGAVLIGDSVGFVDPFGSSGIFPSMRMAQLWTEQIAAAMSQCRGGSRPLWTRRNLARWRHAYHSSAIYRRIRASYLKVGALEWYVFKHLRTAARINGRWSAIAKLLQLG
ncbi:MAG: NAD(P)/FAD-dependent oxidoreductase [Deltaproteobacteria bacterium]|nr:NAD(P)/FAD-dependent oxidoreductase [Deltaproteobacteria bacterium]